MTTITIEREVLDEIVELFDSAITARFPHEILRDLRAALAAPATAPEKTVKEIMGFVRHYAANTFSSATLEDKIRRSLATPATAPAQPERKHTEAEVDEWVAAFLKCSTNGEFREEARRILGVSHG